MSDLPIQRGGDVSAQDLAQFNALQSCFDPKLSLDRIDSFAKWIFAASAIVGALGVSVIPTGVPHEMQNHRLAPAAAIRRGMFAIGSAF
jgi:hypothetical protein